MRNIVIVGNWKMNKDSKETKEFMDEFKTLHNQNKSKIDDKVKFGIASPAVSLDALSNSSLPGMFVAAQNMHEQPSGAFTGELSIELVKSTGANAVVIGHSERREMFNETNESVNAKTKVALENDITPIVCVGETLQQYESGQTKDIVGTQIKESLKGITEWDKVIIAYEPIWAIGTGKTATAQDAQDVCSFIRSITSEDVVIQYGGSVKPENVEELMSQPDIDGALVGGASLDPKSFIKLLTLNK